jgi:tRNA pseudouridine38-40 synthase
MHAYKIIVSYDGTDFHGWQEQATSWTIVSTLKMTFLSVFKKKIFLLGASRTDAGVHAQQQVALLKTELLIDPQKLVAAWNFRLPASIKVVDASPVDYSFNPRSKVKEKTYHYRLFTQMPDPFVGRFGWLYPWMHQVDLKIFEQVLQLYVGTYDFASFCKRQDEVSTIRTVRSIQVFHEKLDSSLLIEIKGPSFAHYQIRRMIGYALDASRHPKTALERISDLLQNPCHEQPLTKAAASGLTLFKIEYENE